MTRRPAPPSTPRPSRSRRSGVSGIKTLTPSFAIAVLLLVSLVPTSLGATTPSILWRFQLPGQYVPVDPVMAADGTLYVMDLLGTLHAVDPGGAEKWSLPGVGPQGLDIGPDGTLYAGNDLAVTAVNPDGTVKWTYAINPIALVSYGPAVGPQGNVYFAATSITPIGQVLSLTPAGTLRWSTPMSMIPTVSFADPVFGKAPDGGQQFVFGGYGIERVDCDDGSSASVGGSFGMPVSTNAAGNIYNQGNGYDSAGNLLFHNSDILLDTSLDGGVYGKGGIGIKKVNGQTGATIWQFSDGIGTLDGSPLTRNPADTRILYGGNAPGYGSASIRYATTSGQFLWALDLPVDNGRISHLETRPVFSPDGAKAFFGSTSIFSGPTPNCYLYAVELEPAPWTVLPGGIAGGGDVPQIHGTGPLTTGSVNKVELTGGPAAGVTHLVIGFDDISAPVFGGLLVPRPDAIVFGLPLDASGGHAFSFVLPATIAPGTEIVFQHWMPDAGAALGWSASHGLRGWVP